MMMFNDDDWHTVLLKKDGVRIRDVVSAWKTEKNIVQTKGVFLWGYLIVIGLDTLGKVKMLQFKQNPVNLNRKGGK